MTERQRNFVQAAVKIVADQGMSRLTIRNVASAVGVTEPAVYRHFPSKLSLMEAILQELQQSIRPKFALLLEQEASLEERISGFIHGLFGALEEKPEFAFFLFSEEVFHREPLLKGTLYQMMQDNLKAFEEAFRSMQKDGICRNDVAPRDLAVLSIGTIRFSVSQWCWYQREQQRSLSESAASLSDTFGKLLRKQ